MKKQNYTLIEILVAVSIIAILVAVAMGAYSGVQRKALLNRAVADCNAIQLAIKNFEAEYTRYPNLTVNGSGTTADPFTGLTKTATGANEDDYDKLMGTLTGIKARKIPAENYTMSACGNSKKIKFLDLPSKYAEKGFVDPWGEKYTIIWNSTGETKMEIKVGSKTITLLTPVAVFTKEGGGGSRYATSWGGVIDLR